MMSRQLNVKDPARLVDGAELRGRLLAGLPITEQRLRLAEASTTVLEGGDGPPVVLLHGGTDSGGVSWAHTAFAVASADPHGATRWRFE
jgi:hypothetical protein